VDFSTSKKLTAIVRCHLIDCTRRGRDRSAGILPAVLQPVTPHKSAGKMPALRVQLRRTFIIIVRPPAAGATGVGTNELRRNALTLTDNLRSQDIEFRMLMWNLELKCVFRQLKPGAPPLSTIQCIAKKELNDIPRE
jgi:hypothetical protein